MSDQAVSRVLVVEDSSVIRTVIRSELEEAGHEVLEAEDGRAAIALLRDSAPDVVLCDVEMPHADGHAVLRYVLGHPGLREVPFLFLTGRDDAEDVVKGLDDGAMDYVRKPFIGAELRARIAVALRTKHLQDALRDRNAELERLASTDVLTGLFNRRFMIEQGQALLAHVHRHGLGLACLLLDADHFKAVNDQHGHAAGDAVLVGLARRLADELRAEDLLGRWGGEELLLLAREADLPGAMIMAERLRAAVARAPFATEGADVSVTASIGVATAAPGDRFDDLVARADLALYRAKERGRDQVQAAPVEG